MTRITQWFRTCVPQHFIQTVGITVPQHRDYVWIRDQFDGQAAGYSQIDTQRTGICNVLGIKTHPSGVVPYAYDLRS